MKAILYSKFGPPDVLRFQEVEKPVPKDREILIEVRAASVNPYDWRHLRADPFFIRLMGAGLLKPKHRILGADVAGRVKPIVDRCFPLEETAEALRYLETGHARGKVVITV